MGRGLISGLGTTVKVHSEVIQIGKTMAMIRGSMESLDGKIIYATCEQHKVAVPTQPEHLQFKVAWDDLWDKEGDQVKKEKARL